MERDHLKQELRRARIPYRKVRGLRDESSALIHLCDALAGLLRDAEEGKPYAGPLVVEFQKKGILQRL